MYKMCFVGIEIRCVDPALTIPCISNFQNSKIYLRSEVIARTEKSVKNWHFMLKLDAQTSGCDPGRADAMGCSVGRANQESEISFFSRILTLFLHGQKKDDDCMGGGKFDPPSKSENKIDTVF